MEFMYLVLIFKIVCSASKNHFTISEFSLSNSLKFANVTFKSTRDAISSKPSKIRSNFPESFKCLKALKFFISTEYLFTNKSVIKLSILMDFW